MNNLALPDKGRIIKMLKIFKENIQLGMEPQTENVKDWLL